MCAIDAGAQRASRLIRTMAEVVGDQVHDLVTSGAWKGHMCWLGEQPYEGSPEE